MLMLGLEQHSMFLPLQVNKQSVYGEGLKPRATKSTSPTMIGSGSCGKTLEEVPECFGS